ncbi:MFS transporter [Agromyces laixinhei]|uniref:MFS transporter n=1 Tax=Agromyces laixinhei TaxID=2585717 RepID=UPI0018DC12E0|nr:MFS transporter [Agromyces laixinhei]
MSRAASPDTGGSAATSFGMPPGLPASPTRRVSRPWIAGLSLAYLGINIAWAGPGQVLMSPQVEWLTTNAPIGFFTDSKESNLAIIGFVAGIFALVSTPLWGALSDRTRSRWGRRTPWVAVGLVVVAVTMSLSGFAQSLPALLLTWVAMQTAINAVISPMSAAIPDHVPPAQRGLVSGWYGFAYTLAVVAGTAIGTISTAVWPSMLGIGMGYVLCAVACLVAAAPFVLSRWERSTAELPRAPRFGWRDLVACFWIDLRVHRDFGWAWVTRFLVTLSTAISLFYLYYYLQDRVGLIRDDSAAAGLRVSDGVLILTAVYAASVFLTVVAAGVVSDRVGRRRPFVAVSAMFLSAATLIMAFVPDFTFTVIAAAVLGLGTGVFTAVDFALVTEVLPEAADNGKDVGIINLAIGLPNVLAPVIAAIAVQQLGGYVGLYLFAGALALAGGLLVYRIRGVR